MRYSDGRPPCGHKYCPEERCGYMPTVKGSATRVTKLDPEGKPTGETFDISGFTKFPETDLSSLDAAVVPWLKPTTVEFTLLDPDPDAIALLFYGRTLKPRPRWWKLLPKRLRNWIKTRELRRGYGG